MFTRLKIKNLTVLQETDTEPSTGLNVFIGENGSGKTHLLKAAYCIAAGLAQEGDLLFDFTKGCRSANMIAGATIAIASRTAAPDARRLKAPTAVYGLDGRRSVTADKKAMADKPTVIFTANRGYALTSSRTLLIQHFLSSNWNVVLATADDVIL